MLAHCTSCEQQRSLSHPLAGTAERLATGRVGSGFTAMPSHVFYIFQVTKRLQTIANHHFSLEGKAQPSTTSTLDRNPLFDTLRAFQQNVHVHQTLYQAFKCPLTSLDPIRPPIRPHSLQVVAESTAFTASQSWRTKAAAQLRTSRLVICGGLSDSGRNLLEAKSWSQHFNKEITV